MGAVRMVAGGEIRRRWKRVVVLVLLVGVVGAVVLSIVAGARRSESALARFNASSRAGDLELTVGDPTASQLRAFGRVAGVEAFAPLLGGALVFPQAPQLQAIASAIDTRFAHGRRSRSDRRRVVPPIRAAVDEVTIGEALAAQLHLQGRWSSRRAVVHPEQVARCWSTARSGPSAVPAGPRFACAIVGIVRRPLDLGDRGAAGGVLVLTPAFTHQSETSIGSFSGTVLRVRTRHGAADVARVAAAARDGSSVTRHSSAFRTSPSSTQGAQNAIDVLTVALWVFAGVAALAGSIAITIVLSREVFTERDRPGNPTRARSDPTSTASRWAGSKPCRSLSVGPCSPSSSPRRRHRCFRSVSPGVPNPTRDCASTGTVLALGNRRGRRGDPADRFLAALRTHDDAAAAPSSATGRGWHGSWTPAPERA